MLILLTGACYEPEGEFVAKPQPADYSKVKLSLDALEDTVYISAYTQVTYSIQDFEPLGYSDVFVWIGDELIYEGNSFVGVINIDPLAIGTGVYKLRLELLTSSGSGSLADKMLLEYTTLYKEVVLVIEADPPPPRVLTVKAEDGTLMLRWNAFTEWNFANYVIFKYTSWNGVDYFMVKTTEINDPQITEWRDEGFVGGYAGYEIQVNTGCQKAVSQMVRYNYLPQTAFKIENRKAVLSWERPMFYANTKRVELWDYNANLHQASVTDTVYRMVTDAMLGVTGSDVEVRFVSESDEQFYSFRIPYYVGERFDYPKVCPRLYNTAYSQYYGQNPGLVRLTNDFEPGSVVENAVAEISMDGQHFVAFRYPYETESYLTVLDPETMYKIDETAISGGLGFDHVNQWYWLKVANNGFVLMKCGARNRVVDLAGFRDVFDESFIDGVFAISPSGQYLLVQDRLLKYNGSEYQSYATLIRTPSNAVFDRNEMLILGSGTTEIHVVNPSDMAITTYATPVYYSSFSYDATIDKLLCSGQGKCFLFSVGSGAGMASPLNTQATLLNGSVFASGEPGRFFRVSNHYFAEP